LGDWAALWFSHTGMAQADDNIGTFRTQLLSSLPSGLDRIGEGDRAGIDRELNGVGPHHAEQTKPDAAALQQHMALDQFSLRKFLELGKPWMVAIEMSVGSENRRNVTGLLGRRDRLCKSLRAGIELMIAECRRIISGH